MAGIKIPNLPSYGAIDTSKAKKDLLITTKNDGTYGTPTYPTNASKQLTVEELATMLPLPLNGNAFRLYDLGQTELVANTYNIIGNPATAPTVTTFTLPIVLPNKMLVAGVGATASPFIIEITGGYSGGSASNPITVQLTEVGDTVFFIGTDYGWQYVGSNKITDLTGYATESYVDAKVEDTIVNGVTDKAPSQNAVFDAIAGIPTPTLATVTTAGNTTTNDVTVGSATVSNATVSTLPFIDSAKKIISATGSLLGTWFQTLTADTTPVDTDTIVVNDSTASFQAKKTTMLQLWTNYIKTKADATYNAVFTISNNVWVDLNNGSDSTGTLQRIDRPYRTVQACINALGTGNVSWVVNVLGNYEYTNNEYAITTNNKNNVIVNFYGNISSSLNSSTSTSALINLNISQNWQINFYSINQKTNIGIINTTTNSLNCFVNIEIGILRKGKTFSLSNYLNGTGSRFVAKNLKIDLSSDTGISSYYILLQLTTNCIVSIDYLEVFASNYTGILSTAFVYGNLDYCLIKNTVFNISDYSAFDFYLVGGASGTIKYLELNNITQSYVNQSKPNSSIVAINFNVCKIDNVDLLAGFTLFGGNISMKSLTLGNIYSNNLIGVFFDGVINITGQVKRSEYRALNMFILYGGVKLTGGKIIDFKTQFTWGAININPQNSKFVEISNCIISDEGTVANANQRASSILLEANTRLKLSNVSIVAPLGNTNPDTTAINTNSGASSYIIEGDYACIYNRNTFQTITNNAQVDVITNLQF